MASLISEIENEFAELDELLKDMWFFLIINNLKVIKHQIWNGRRFIKTRSQGGLKNGGKGCCWSIATCRSNQVGILRAGKVSC